MKKVQSSCAKWFQVKKASSSDEPKTSCFADARGGRAKKTANLDKEDAAADSKGGALRIMWSESRTERLLEWLENNVEDCQRLFSDSAQDAKEEKHRPRTAKSGKSSLHTKIANYVFSADEDARVQDDVNAHGPQIFAKVVENRIAK